MGASCGESWSLSDVATRGHGALKPEACRLSRQGDVLEVEIRDSDEHAMFLSLAICADDGYEAPVVQLSAIDRSS